MKLEIIRFPEVGEVVCNITKESLGTGVSWELPDKAEQILMSNYEGCMWLARIAFSSWVYFRHDAILHPLHMAEQACLFMDRECGRYNAAQIKKFAALNETTWHKWATDEFRRAVDQEIRKQARRRLNACNQRRAILLGKKPGRRVARSSLEKGCLAA